VGLASPCCVCFDFSRGQFFLGSSPTPVDFTFPVLHSKPIFLLERPCSQFSSHVPRVLVLPLGFFCSCFAPQVSAPSFGVPARERRPDLFPAAAFADFAAGQCAPVSSVPTIFFCRRPSLARRGLAAQPLIFLSRVACIRAGQIQLLPRSIHGRIFLLLQFSPLERPSTVLHLSFSRRSSAIPGCCSWFRFSL
jgi:hypothetical protein